MYSNDYDDGALMNSYIDWSKRWTSLSAMFILPTLARLHQRTLRIHRETQEMQRGDEESEEVRADELGCWKCRGETTEMNENLTTFPHIQDLCPADRRRIAQLVKQLIKCTKEMRDAKSELAVSESEKDAMRNQYQKSLDRHESDKKQLEFELCQARTETNELKTRVSRALELLTQQIAAHEKQFVDLTETVRDLAREKAQLQNTLEQKQSETEAFQAKYERTKALLEMEKLLRSKERSKQLVEHIHQSCQTEELETSPSMTDRVSATQNSRIKSKDDLDQLSTDGTLIRDLFFRKPSVEESGTLDIIPVLSQIGLRSRRSDTIAFM